VILTCCYVTIHILIIIPTISELSKLLFEHFEIKFLKAILGKIPIEVPIRRILLYFGLIVNSEE
jgi:hypothetical protein